MKNISEFKIKALGLPISKDEKCKMLFENITDAILIADTRGRIVDANQIACRMFGYPKKQLLSLHVRDLHPRSKVKETYELFSKLSKKKSNESFDVDILTKNNQIKTLSLKSKPFKLGNKQYVLGDFRDITEIKKYEKLLKEENLKFKKIFESTPVPAAISTIKDGMFIDVNLSFTQMLGFKYNEVIGHTSGNLRIFAYPDERDEVINELKKYGKVKAHEVHIRRKNGEILTMLFSANVLIISGKKYLLTQARDITSEKKMQNILKENEQHMRTVLDCSPIPKFVLDKDHKVINWNKALEALTGISAKRAIGKKYHWQVFYDKKRPCLADLLLDGAFNKIPKLYPGIWSKSKLLDDAYEGTNYFPDVGKNGKWLHFTAAPIKDSNNVVTGAEETLEDVTEHKQFEEMIIQSERKYSALVENINDSVIVIRDGLVVFANKASERMIGYNLNEVVGKKFIDLVAPKYKKLVGERYKKRIQGEKVADRYEIEIILKDGKSLAVEITPSVIEFEGKPSTLVVGRDITAAKQLDKAKSEFISVASHQLRSPLTGIKWFSQLILARKVGNLNEKQIDFINQIYNSNERMIRLVNDLLDVSHVETGQKFTIKKTTGDVIMLIDSVIRDQKVNSSKKKITIEPNESCKNKLIFKFDKEKIYQVFANLINNSIKYSASDTKIIVGLKCLKSEVEFFVKDFGYGIPSRQKNRIFEKFFRADNIAVISTDGTGLGLYIAKNIVEAHGGRIWFESEQNKGTTFHFTLPRKNK